MSDGDTTLNTRVPRATHKKAKDDAKAAGLTLKDYMIQLIDVGLDGDRRSDGDELSALLTKRRESDQFGDETILQEIHRRVVSIHLMSADHLSARLGEDAAMEALSEMDELTENIVSQR